MSVAGGLETAGPRAGRGRKTDRGFPRITIQGVAFGAAAAITGFAGFSLNNNFVILLFCFMVTAFLFSAWYPFSSLFRLDIQRRPPPDLFAGDTAEFEVILRKRSLIMPVYAVSLRDLMEWFPGGRAPEAWFMYSGRGSAERSVYSARFQRRGLYDGGAFTLWTSFPFGFFNAFASGSTDSKFIVFPKLRYVSGGVPSSCQAGVDRPSLDRFGGDAEFKRLREYVQGDNPRSIHWKSSAKHGKLMVRDEERYEMKRATVLVDARPPEIKGRVKRFVAFERAVSIAASAAAMLDEAGYVYRLVICGAEGDLKPPARGPAHLRGIFTDLALLSPAASAPPTKALNRLLTGPPEEIIVVVSWPGAADEARGAASRPGSVSVIDASRAVAGKKLAPPRGWAPPCAWRGAEPAWNRPAGGKPL